MPQILEDEQTEPVFMPETHLPTVPRVVDMQKYEEKKKDIDAAAKENPKVLEELNMKPGPPVELTLAKGDLAEKELVEKIKEFFAASPDKEVVVYQGPQIRKPRKGKGQKEEQECCDEQVLRQGQDRQGWKQCCQRADLHQPEAVQVPRVPARPSRQAQAWHAGGGRGLRPQARHLPRDEGQPFRCQVQGIQDCQDRQRQRA